MLPLNRGYDNIGAIQRTTNNTTTKTIDEYHAHYSISAKNVKAAGHDSN
jgi:hypothetical protein